MHAIIISLKKLLFLTILITCASCDVDGTVHEFADGSSDGSSVVSTEESSDESSGTSDSGSSRTIIVASVGGSSYEESQIEAYHKPWSDDTGNQVTFFSHNDVYSRIVSWLESGSFTWDVIDLEAEQAIAACDQGLLEPIDVSALQPAPDGTPASEDFIPGTLFPCGVATTVSSTLIAFNSDLVSAPPAAIADFFDLVKFPGKRGVQKNPEIILEMALMADGVAASQVYSELETTSGIERALAKLNEIKSEIIWWREERDSIDQLTDGEVVMTTTPNNRAFSAIKRNGMPFGRIWDGQVWDVNLWVIPKSSPNKDLAFDFVKFSTGSEPLATQASYRSNGPPRYSSHPLVGFHVELGIDMKPEVPTAPQNFSNVLALDRVFWAANEVAIKARFESWLSE